jgi:hypothetical protein
MMQQDLLNSIISDLGKIAEDYSRAGFLDENTRERAARSLIGEAQEILAFRRLFLLSEALLRNVAGKWVYAHGRGPKHVAVFGGTNVGKSTCVNVLLGKEVAGAHLTAGYTRHAQAFLPLGIGHDGLFGGNKYSFLRFTRAPVEELDRETLDRFGVHLLHGPSPLPDVVLWDTPDCDSVESRRYMAAVVEAVTQADLVVYVTTGQKYAVDFLVEWVLLLARAGTPLIGCLNLTKQKDQKAILESQKEYLRIVGKRHDQTAPDLEMIGFYFANDEADLYTPSHLPGIELRQRVLAMLSATDQKARVRKALEFAKDRLPHLLDPARAELEAIDTWEKAIDAGLSRFTADYEAQYLQDPQRYDAYKRVTLEILNLLDPDIPGLAEGLRFVRKVLRWPSRLILTFGKWIITTMFGGGESEAKLPPEAETYKAAHEILLRGLTDLITANRKKARHHPFWDELESRWEQELTTIQVDFATKLQQHFERTDTWIKDAAKDIFKQLEKSPTLLNGLRTARVTVDAGMIVFTIMTAGHVSLVQDLIHDGIIAPLLLTGTETAVVGMTEQYVEGRRQQLRDDLLADAEKFATDVYGQRLRDLSKQMIHQVGFVHVGRDVIDSLVPRVAALASVIDADERRA